jgi:hypothetical protein
LSTLKDAEAQETSSNSLYCLQPLLYNEEMKFLGVVLTLALYFGLAVPVSAASLVGHWTFDESSGTVAADSSDSHNDGALTGDQVWVPGKIGNAFLFSGDDYFTISRPVDSDLTFCTWIQTTSTGYTTEHWVTMEILDGELGFLNPDFGFGVDVNGHLAYGNGGAYDATVNGTTAINDGAWHHVCATRNRASQDVYLYVDGVEDMSGQTDGTFFIGNDTVLIGGAQDGGANFNGLIDDLRVYDYALSADDIARVYAGTFDSFSNSNNESPSPARGNGPIFIGQASALPGYVAPRSQIIYPDGTVVYAEDNANAPSQLVDMYRQLLALFQEVLRQLQTQNGHV